MRIKKIDYALKENIKSAVKKDKKGIENDTFRFEAKSDHNIFELVVHAKRDVAFDYMRIEFDKDDFFKGNMLANGFQSWSETKILSERDKIRGLNFFTNKARLEKYGDYHFYKKGNNTFIYSHEMTYIVKDGVYKFIGSLNQDFAYTILEKEFKNKDCSVFLDLEGLVLKAGESFRVAKLYYKASEQLSELFDEYFDLVEGPRDPGDVCTGWSSWENYNKNIDEEIIIKNAEIIKTYGLNYNYIIIDEGYESEVGDWLEIGESFHNDMKETSDKIKELGYTPGLYLNPFCCSENSKLFKEHRNWVLKDENGTEIISGVNDTTKEKYYALDFYCVDFKEYLKTIFETITKDWGFELVKLSNLYAVAIIPRENKTRSMVMSDALNYINKLTPNVKLLGTGVPLGVAFKKLDYCRVTCNINKKWQDRRNEFVGFRERASVTSSIHSLIYRYFMNKRAFGNVAVSNVLHQAELDDYQKYTIMFLNYLLSDASFFADKIEEYTDYEMKLIKSIFPIKKPKFINIIHEAKNFYQFEFEVEDQQYIAYTNIASNSEAVKLSPGMYFEPSLGFIQENKIINIRSNQTLCFAKVKDNANKVWFATDGYIFPLIEYKDFSYDDGDMIMQFIEGFNNKCKAYVAATENVGIITINGEHAEMKQVEEHLFVWQAQLNE